MYLDFYLLTKAPFHITPDPEFLFLSASHKAALGAITYGVQERQGFVTVVGEVGVGKTTILRAYLEHVDSNQVKAIFIPNANLSFHDLLRLTLGDFGLEVRTDDYVTLITQFHKLLIEEYAKGRNVAIIIDETQIMPVETLEQLRLLSNLETSTEKPLQIVLVGQPELQEKLSRPELRQLGQRIVLRTTIFPLTEQESYSYIRHRLAKVTLQDGPIFTQGALKLLVRRAQGIPRVLNILCTNALVAGFGAQQKPVTASIVKDELPS